jgi:hypothetical protein
VEEKPPQKKPIGTVTLRGVRQECESKIGADRKNARREHFRDTKTGDE